MFRTFQSRFIFGCAILVFLIIAVALISLTRANELVRTALAARLDTVEASFQSAIEQESLCAFTLAETVARDPDMIAAFAAKNRTELRRRLTALFNELKSRHGIEQAHFHLPPAISFLRMHNPEIFGDDISASRKMVVIANQTRQPLRGIEVGVGGLGMRAVVPISKDGVHLGTFEYGVTFGEVLLKRLASIMRMTVGVYLAKDGKFNTVGTTFPAGYHPGTEALATALRGPRFEPAVAIGDATYAIRLVPIRDYGGDAVAVAVFGVDRTHFQQMINNNFWEIGLVTLAALALLAGMAFSFMRAVIQPINRLVGDMGRLAHGDMSVDPARGARADEVGDMCRAVEVFRTNAITLFLMDFALNNVREAAYLIDGDARFRFVNEEACRILGYTREEMLCLGVADVDPDFPKDRWPHHWQELHVQRSLVFEGRHKTKDGRIFPVEISANYFEYGKSAYNLALARDISERKRAEAEILQLNRELELRVAERTADLEKANGELEAFSYSVSHDLRAPLRAIDGFAHLLMEEHTGSLDAEGRHYLDLVCQGANHMGRLIEDMLSFSRMSRSEMGTVMVDMTALAREAFDELIAAAPGRNIRFTVGDLPPARCDRAMIHQVLSNLLDNALKYTGPKPEPLIEVTGSTVGTENIYCVRDNGVGFDMQYADKLFGVFQRLHSTGEFEGTGIGLAIVRRIIERHGGRVWAEGNVGEGAAIYFALPHGKDADG